MATYMLKVTRIVPHPKAGKELPRSGTVLYYNDNPPPTFPDTMSDGVLSVEVSEDDWTAIKAAVLERYK